MKMFLIFLFVCSLEFVFAPVSFAEEEECPDVTILLAGRGSSDDAAITGAMSGTGSCDEACGEECIGSAREPVEGSNKLDKEGTHDVEEWEYDKESGPQTTGNTHHITIPPKRKNPFTYEIGSDVGAIIQIECDCKPRAGGKTSSSSRGLERFIDFLLN